MNIVAIVSGGMDSAVMVYALRRDGHNVQALSFNYGQKHAVELGFAKEMCAELGVPWSLIDLSSLRGFIGGDSSQMRDDVPVPDGHYTEEVMKQTVVPNRNMIMLSIAIARAVATKSQAVAYGAHAGDHTIYPDCREVFASAMATAAGLCDWHEVRLLRPFVEMSKADIALLGHELGVPFEKTWSCYKGRSAHCGTCGTCVERREAFQLAGVPDPTRYAP